MRPFRLAVVCAALLTLGVGFAQKPPDKAEPEKPYLVLDTGGHTAAVRKALFTPDGTQVITCGFDKTIRIWDALTGESLRVLRVPIGPGDEGFIDAAAISPDGKTLAVSGMPFGKGKYGIPVYLIGLESGRIEKVLKGHTNLVDTLAFSPDGRYLASGSYDKTILIQDLKGSSVDKKLEGHADRVSGVAFSPDGKRLASSGDKVGRVWSLATGKTTAELKGHTDALNCVAWSGDGKTVATGSVDGTIRTYDPDGTFRKSFTDPNKEQVQVISLNFRRDAPLLLYTGIGTTGRAGIIDLATGAVTVQFPGHNNSVMHGSFSNDGKRVVSTGGNDNETFIWDAEDGSVIQKLYALGRSVWAVGWSPDGKTVAWGSTNRGRPDLNQTVLERTFRIDDLEFSDPPDEKFNRAELSRGKRGLEIGKDLELFLKDGDTLTAWKKSSPGERAYCFTMVDDKRAAIGTGYGLHLVDLENNKILKTYNGHTGIVLSVALSPDGKYLLSGGTDQTLRVWDPLRDEPLLSIFVAGPEWIAWTPEGYYAASAYGERLMGWVVNNGPEAMATFHPAVQFRKSLYRPDVIKLLLEAGSIPKALAAANKEKKEDAVNVAQVLPPQVAVTSPASPSGTRLTAPKLDVKATAKSVGKNPVTALRLIVDGRPYKGSLHSIDKPKLGEVKDSWSIELPPGKHTIAVQAESAVSKGLSPFVEVTRAGNGPDGELPALYVLAIGVSEYAGKMKLRYAADDADNLSRAFVKRTGKAFRKVEVKVLKDRDATRKNILDGLAWLEKVMTPQDVAVFSFSGHGARAPDGRFFFIPVDVDVENVVKTCVSGDELKDALAAVPGRIITVLDACHSGAAARDRRDVPPTADLVRDLVTDDYGVIALCSSLGREYSLEGPDVEAGYFTYALIEGLAGDADANKDGIVSLTELERFTTSRVSELTKGKQHPVMGHPATMRSFPLAVREAPAP